jgi:hypothetical protein
MMFKLLTETFNEGTAAANKERNIASEATGYLSER